MSTQHRNNDSSLNNLSEPGASQSSTSGTTGGSTGAFDSGKGKEGSTPIGTYDTSSTHNTPGAQQIDSYSGAIPNTQTQKNKSSPK
ncbi:unnamed protein product [Rotaria sordida]|uniref:Uncharacterized protein n=1 Tax=Rotaria sordida TaxID=392033 RepID=A0A814YCT5_9BILA|nr:unnamed protein product [Rotaria sordida]CAF1227809.1 unnamed protein product [Rotaria sordida]